MTTIEDADTTPPEGLHVMAKSLLFTEEGLRESQCGFEAIFAMMHDG